MRPLKNGENYFDVQGRLRAQEPTIGLHMADIERFLDVVSRLVCGGNTVIEHNLDVIKHSYWFIDMGPEGGSKGGEAIAEGTPQTDRSGIQQLHMPVPRKNPPLTTSR